MRKGTFPVSYTHLDVYKRQEHKIKNAAIIRIEQLYPLNYEMLKEIVAKYPRAQKKWIWCQEEPRNMGAFYYIRPRLEELSNHKPVSYTHLDVYKRQFLS